MSWKEMKAHFPEATRVQFVAMSIAVALTGKKVYSKENFDIAEKMEKLIPTLTEFGGDR